MKNFGPIFKKARMLYSVNKNIKAYEVAKLLGISGSYLSDIESGKKTPSLDMLTRFYGLYGDHLCIEHFFEREGTPPI